MSSSDCTIFGQSKIDAKRSSSPSINCLISPSTKYLFVQRKTLLWTCCAWQPPESWPTLHPLTQSVFLVRPPPRQRVVLGTTIAGSHLRPEPGNDLVSHQLVNTSRVCCNVAPGECILSTVDVVCHGRSSGRDACGEVSCFRQFHVVLSILRSFSSVQLLHCNYFPGQKKIVTAKIFMRLIYSSIRWYQLRFDIDVTHGICALRARVADRSRCRMISQDRTVDQPHEYLSCNNFFGQGSIYTL